MSVGLVCELGPGVDASALLQFTWGAAQATAIKLSELRMESRRPGATRNERYEYLAAYLRGLCVVLGRALDRDTDEVYDFFRTWGERR